MEFLEILKVIFLGIVEGITEWLPISSTGHMILVDEFIKLGFTQEFKDMFFVVIQLGAILAVVTLYFKKLNPFALSKSKEEKVSTWKTWLKILIACVPAGLIGVVFDDFLDEHLHKPIVIAITLILYGILFIVIEVLNKKKSPKINDIAEITYTTAILIGIAQVLSLIPGTSRSGATIIGAMLIGCSRAVAAEFTFYLAIPVMFGASLFKIVKYIHNVKDAVGSASIFSGAEIGALLIGMIVAYVVSIIAIKFLMKYIKKNDFKVFGVYRIILGIIVIVYFMFLVH